MRGWFDINRGGEGSEKGENGVTVIQGRHGKIIIDEPVMEIMKTGQHGGIEYRKKR